MYIVILFTYNQILLQITSQQILLENIRNMKREVNKTDREIKRTHYERLYDDIDKESQPTALDIEAYSKATAADRFRDELESLGLPTKKQQSRDAKLSAEEYLMTKDTPAERFRDTMKNLGLKSKKHLKDKDAIQMRYCPGYTTTKTKLYTLSDLEGDQRANVSKAKVPVIRDASPVRLSVRSRFKASDYADVDSVLLSRARAQRPYEKAASETSISDYQDVDSVLLSKAKAQREYKKAASELSIAGVREYAANVLKGLNHRPKPNYAWEVEDSFLLDDIPKSKVALEKSARPSSARSHVTFDSEPEVLLKKMKNLSYVTLSDLKSQRAPGNYGSDFTISGGEVFPSAPYSEYPRSGHVTVQDISSPSSGYTSAKRFAATHYSPSMSKHYSTTYDNIYEQLPPLYQFYDSHFGKNVSSYPTTGAF